MGIAITIRDVPEDVRDALGLFAQQQGQSLQSYLLGVITRQARFVRNRLVLADVERELAAGGGAGPGAPDAADVLAAARARQDPKL